MSEDFPAAHSMDSDWFAIDADGYVALCSSGETGLVPWGRYEFPENKTGQAVQYFDLDGARVAEVAAEEQILVLHQEKEASDWFSGICVLVDDAALGRLLNIERGVSTGARLIRFAGPGAVYYVEYCSVADIYAAFRRKDLLAIHVVVDAYWGNFEVEVLGCYRYDAADYQYPACYQQTKMPQRPIHVSEFPKEMAEHLKGYAFSQFRFKEAENIYPAILMECRDYGGRDLYEMWFAVDADGCIGLFSAHDGKKVGLRCLELPNSKDWLGFVNILELFPRDEKYISQLDLDGALAANWAASADRLQQLLPDQPNRWFSAIYVLTSDDALDALIIHPGGAQMRFAGPRPVYYMELCGLHEVQAAQQRGELLHVREIDAENVPVEALGFYHYTAATHIDANYQI